MQKALSLLLTLLQKIWGRLGTVVAVLNQSGVGGFVLSSVVIVAFIFIWHEVLGVLFDAATTYLTGIGPIGVFNSVPGGVMYLLNAGFPTKLFFQLTLNLLIFRLSVSQLLMVAIAATRKLKM